MIETTSADDRKNSEDSGELLSAAYAARKAILDGGPQEWRAFFLWGIWVLLFVPPFDFLNGNLWGPIVWGTSIIGAIVTTYYFWKRAQRVHWVRHSSWQNWLVIYICYGVIMGAAAFLHTHFRYTWTVAALLAVVPYFTTAYIIRNRERKHVAP